MPRCLRVLLAAAPAVLTEIVAVDEHGAATRVAASEGVRMPRVYVYPNEELDGFMRGKREEDALRG